MTDRNPTEGGLVPSRRALKEVGKRALGHAFVAAQALGVDLLPRHFYSSIPDVRALRATSHWRQPRTMHGVLGADPDEQLRFLETCLPAEVRSRVLGASLHADACAENGTDGYGPIESDVLYAFIASCRPRRVLQVGAGVSTAIVLRARRELAIDVEVACIDPFPNDYLRRAEAEGEISLHAEPAQDVDLGLLTNLDAGDLLFVDSTHTVKPGSEVSRLILEVLPRLRPGVFVHFHDITWPYDYQPSLLDGALFFWEEATLLLALMVGNGATTIRMSLSMLHHHRAAGVQRLLPHYRPRVMDEGLYAEGARTSHFPSSTYLQRL